ncbi:MAG: putative manganese-dependent inorganic diphosphatase [Lachnospiraceae bacterium]|nr:putative manganese-dependent inorganic diphosphatase [Lachnospiraceae bacterium]
MSEGKRIYVVGHKNPDTDSICSAIAYAELKNRTAPDGWVYVPKRAGHMNKETEFVLKTFGVETPGYMPGVGCQARDMEIHTHPYVPQDITVMELWDILAQNNAVTMPFTDEEQHLEGLLTVGDIARYFMNPEDVKPLSSAHTLYSCIAKTLQGSIVVGDGNERFTNGKVLIGAGNEGQISERTKPGDLVVLADREEAQFAAMKAGAGCLVISCDSEVQPDLIEEAKIRGCVVITTPMDTYTIARIINLATPARFLMRTENLITFSTRDALPYIKEVMGQTRLRDFPVIDSQGRCKGTVSRRNLINTKKKQVVLVDHNEESQAVDDIRDAEILEIIDHHRIGSIETLSPIYFRNQPVGCTATIITQMYHESRQEITPQIAGLLLSAILSDTLMFRSPTCTSLDENIARYLADIAKVDVESYANDMFAAGSDVQEKSAEEIFYQDFKKFSVGDVSFGVAQITSMNSSVLDVVGQKVKPYMEDTCGKNDTQMLFFMLTNIITESTDLICVGEGSTHYVENAFQVKVTDGHCVLPGVVSRKKQMIPAMMSAIHEN